MGFALAAEAAKRGAEVKLIMGPTKLAANQSGVEFLQVETADQMYEQSVKHFPTADIAIMAAAVSDYKPSSVADKKIKKNTDTLSLELVKNPDIAATLGKQKINGQLLIGFALETDNEARNAQDKLQRKNFDFIVLNSLNDKGAGFNHDTNKISILYKDNKIRKFELKSKAAVATDIMDEVVSLIEKK